MTDLKQRKCLRLYSNIYDIESKTQQEYCHQDTGVTLHWTDYMDTCLNIQCGRDSGKAEDLVESMSRVNFKFMDFLTRV